MNIVNDIVNLYTRVSTELPKDVLNAMKYALDVEVNEDTQKVLLQMIENEKAARNQKAPICQDTGTPVFMINRPINISEYQIKKDILYQEQRLLMENHQIKFKIKML